METNEKNRQALSESVKKEQQILLQYAGMLGSCTDENIRNKLLYTQRRCNEAAAFVLDEAKSRGYIKEIAVDKELSKRVIDSIDYKCHIN